MSNDDAIIDGFLYFSASDNAPADILSCIIRMIKDNMRGNDALIQYLISTVGVDGCSDEIKRHHIRKEQSRILIDKIRKELLRISNNDRNKAICCFVCSYDMHKIKNGFYACLLCGAVSSDDGDYQPQYAAATLARMLCSEKLEKREDE